MGRSILENFTYQTRFEFSEVIEIEDKKIYFVFEIEIIKIIPTPSKSILNIIKTKLKTQQESKKLMISNLNIQPIAYILDNIDKSYHVIPLNENQEKYITSHKDKILKEFKKYHHPI